MQVDTNNARPHVVVEFSDRAEREWWEDPGRGHYHIQATQLRMRCCHDLDDAALVGHLARQQQTLGAGCQR